LGGNKWIKRQSPEQSSNIVRNKTTIDIDEINVGI